VSIDSELDTLSEYAAERSFPAALALFARVRPDCA